MLKLIFLSHSSEDFKTADCVRGIIEAQGLPCWIAPRDIKVGVEWDEAIVAGIREAAAMLVLVSHNANDSIDIKREVRIASELGLRIFPIRIEDVQFANYFIHGSQAVDLFRGASLEQAMVPLIAELRRLTQPVDRPQAPRAPDAAASTRVAEDFSGVATVLSASAVSAAALTPEAAAATLERFGTTCANVCQEFGGRVVRRHAEALVAMFRLASDAVRAAIAVQRTLARAGDQAGRVEARVGLHTGESMPAGPLGLSRADCGVVTRAARIAAAAHGNQIVVSVATRASATDTLEVAGFRDLGTHRVRGLPVPEQVYQVLHPDLPQDFPPLETLDNVPNNLTVPLTSFVGRDTELEQIIASLSESQRRLVTLVGPGGSGKTRLALHAAGVLIAEFRHGVWFVPLAEVREEERLGPMLANLLGVRLNPEQPVTEQVARQLAGQRVLVILDNFEQVTGGKRFLSELLRATTDLRLLVTSRVSLGVQGHREVPVPPLPLPPRRRAVPAAAAEAPPQQVTQYASVRLFLERARDAKSDFAINDKTAPVIAEICVRLDGIPLAIEARRRPHPQDVAGADPATHLSALQPAGRRPRRRSLAAADAAQHDRLVARAAFGGGEGAVR